MAKHQSLPEVDCTIPSGDTSNCTTCGHTVTGLGGLWAEQLCPCGSADCEFARVGWHKFLEHLEQYSPDASEQSAAFVVAFTGDFTAREWKAVDRRVKRWLAISHRRGLVAFDTDQKVYRCVALLPCVGREH
jgi:hypothetical protein